MTKDHMPYAVYYQFVVSDKLLYYFTAAAAALIGNEGVPIQLAQCRFLGLAISSAKI